MKKNMGTTDRIVRFIIAAVSAIIYFTYTFTGIAGIFLLIIGGIFVFTSLTGLCPIYKIFGLNSCSSKKE